MGARDAIVLLAVLVLLVAAVGVADARARGEPRLDVYAPENTFAPGDDARLELTLQNAGDVTRADTAAERDEVTTARAVVVELSADDAPIEIETADGTRPVGTVPEGLSAPVGFDIAVDDDAEPGTYDLPVTIEYTHTHVIGRDGVYTERDERLDTHVTVVVEDDARFRVDAVDSDLFGASGPVTLTLENDGSETAHDATVTLESATAQLSFGGDAAAETFVGDWAPGETRDVTVDATLGDAGDRRAYPLTATVTYDAPDGDARSSSPVSVGVTPHDGSRFGLDAIASTLAVGDEGTVSGTVSNRGGSTARGAVLVLSADTRNVEPVETEYALGDLAPGTSADFAFDADVSESAAGGPRQLSFAVEYRDRSGRVVESEPVDARVEIGPSSDRFTVEPVDASLEPGGAGELRLAVTNVGDDPVTEVSAKLFANAPLSAGDDEAFIDRLGPGETDEIVFALAASGSALSKAYPVSLDFQYDDADGDTHLSDTYQVPVAIATADGDGDLPTGALVGAVALVVIGAVAIYRRRP